MSVSRTLRVLTGLLAAGVVLGGARKSPTTPPADQTDLIGDLPGIVTSTDGIVLQCTPLPYASLTRTIGPEGGVMVIGPHTFLVPPGALPAPVTITAVAPSDQSRSVRLSPEGLQFIHSAYLTLDYSGCGQRANLLPRVAPTTDLLQVLPYVPSVPDARDHLVTGQIDRFSRYAAAY